MSTALITGAGGGFGKVLAWEFAMAGYDLILQCHKSEPPEIPVGGVLYQVVRGDLRNRSTIAELFEISENMGDLRMLVNNAGIRRDEPWAMIGVNLTAPIILTKTMWPLLRNGGMVVNIGSLASIDSGEREPVYGATKAGLDAFSRVAQFDGTQDDVRVIHVRLGALKVGMTAGRADVDKLIDPYEAARVILSTIKNYPTLRITDITLQRRKY